MRANSSREYKSIKRIIKAALRKGSEDLIEHKEVPPHLVHFLIVNSGYKKVLVNLDNNDFCVSYTKNDSLVQLQSFRTTMYERGFLLYIQEQRVI